MVDGATTNPIIQDPVTGMPIGTNPFGGSAPSIPQASTDGQKPLVPLSPGLTRPGQVPTFTTNTTMDGNAPLIGSIGDTSGGFNPGDFDMDSVEGIDQAIAQLQSQIDTGRSGTVPDYSAFFQSPGYQFRQDEGIRAIDRSASARGQLMSGGTLRELQRYGQGLASSEFGNYANRLASLAGLGQTANQQGIYAGAAAGGQVGTSAANIGQSIMAGGTAQAFGIQNANNAFQQGLGGVGSAVQQFGAGQGWWGGFDPSSGITWNTGRF